MCASASLGSVLLGISDQSGVIAAIIAGVFLIAAQVMNNANQSRMQKRELRYRNTGRGGSGINAALLIGLLIAVGFIVYFARRPHDESQASAESEPSTTASTETVAVTSASSTTVVLSKAPCAAFTVQIASIKNDSSGIAPFQDQAHKLAQLLPQLGELHSDAGDACGAQGRTQFYFGPFPTADATRAACFAIGQVLHDRSSEFATFQSQGQIVYPYYRTEDGVSVRGTDGQTLVCKPPLG